MIASLETRPHVPGLVAARPADDLLALRALAQMSDIAALAKSPAAVRLLWEVCQIPDFRKVMSDNHARLLAQIYRHLGGPSGRLPTDWVAGQVSRLDRLDGDIDTLMTRISHVRTWTYITHRGDWLADAPSWQERARAIEDNLSDALHDRITQRFVDKRSAVLVRKLATSGELLASVSASGEVKVEGHYVGLLEGFRFHPDLSDSGVASKTLLAAAQRVLRGEIARRVKQLERANDSDFALTPDGAVAWRGGLVGKLVPGTEILAPKAVANPSDFFAGEQRETVRKRLAAFVEAQLRHGLAPLFQAREAPLSGTARGLAFQLGEALGSLHAKPASPLVASLASSDRKRLSLLGVRFGVESIYLEPLLKPEAIRLRGLLWALASGQPIPRPPKGTAAPRDPAISASAYEAMGYRVLGNRVLRFDRVERLAARARALARQGAFAALPELAQLAGCAAADLPGMLAGLGYRAANPDGNGVIFRARASARRRIAQSGPQDGPFAKLKELTLAR